MKNSEKTDTVVNKLEENKEKVYIVYEDSVFDYERSGDHFIYKNKEDALKKLEDLTLSAIEDYSVIEPTDVVIEKDECSFSIYVSGYYASDHIDISVIEKEILTEYKNSNN